MNLLENKFDEWMSPHPCLGLVITISTVKFEHDFSTMN